MDNLTWGNPKAHRVRVHFISTSTVIYEGMPVCYNHDTTTDWSGGSVSDGAVTTSTSLTAGTPETCAAKWIEVETPSTTNQQWFAGVVAKGGWCGKTTSPTSGVGQILDIYVPNGAVVPVRADISCTEFRSILCLEDSSQALTRLYSSSYATRPVAVAMETVNRTTAGLILAKLDPNMFIQQTDPAGKLIVSGAGAGASTLNSINVTEGFTSGSFCAFEIKSQHTGGSESSYGLAFMARAEVSGDIGGSQTCAAGIRLNITGGTQTGSLSALRVQLTESAEADVSTLGGSYGLSVLNLVNQFAEDPQDGFHFWFFFENDGSYPPDLLLYAKANGDLGDHAAEGTMVGADTGDRMIPVNIGGNIYYIVARADDDIA